MNCKCTLLLVAAAGLLLSVQLPAAQARTNRATIACSMYVSPCHCGLCPRIVDCAKQPTAECFCGTNSPGIYPHPTDHSKFWMCSYDTQTHIPYGVEVPCPTRLVFDPVVKVCTVPAAVSPSPTPPATTSTPPPPPSSSSPSSSSAKPAAQPSGGTSDKSGSNTNSNSGGNTNSNKDSNKPQATSGSSSSSSGRGMSPHWVGVVQEGPAAYRMAAPHKNKYSSSGRKQP